MQVSNLHHIGFVVRSMGPALSRWTEQGAQVVVEPINDPVQRVTVALLAIDGDVPVELVAPMPGVDDVPISARLRRGGGLDHLCFSVPDVAASLAEELERGSVVVCEPVFAVAFTRTVAFVQRRTGLVVEYISEDEAPAGAYRLQAIASDQSVEQKVRIT